MARYSIGDAVQSVSESDTEIVVHRGTDYGHTR